MKWLIVVAALAASCKSEDTRVGPGGPGAPGETVGGQSMKEAMTILCNAEEKSGAKSPIDVAMYIEKHVTHPGVVKMLKSLGPTEKESADAQVRELAKKSGVERCPFAEPKP